MPTGYTYDLVEGKETPEEFMFKSLRAMGVAIMQRDEDLDNPVRYRAVSDHYYKSVEEKKAELAEFLSKSDEDLKVEYIKQVREMSDRKSKKKVINEIENNRIDKAMDLIESKTYPPDLLGWKKFMVEQLEMSRPYPVKDMHYPTYSFEEWKKNEEDCNRRSFEIAQESLTRQIEIAQESNAWLQQAAKILNIEIGEAQDD